MKKYGILLLLFIGIFTTLGKTTNTRENYKLLKFGDIYLKADTTQIDHEEVSKLLLPPPKPKKLGINYDKFIETLSFLESGQIENPYQVVNRYGYMGKFQFHWRTIRGLVRKGYLSNEYIKMTTKQFLNQPDKQHEAFDALIKHNQEVLRNYGLYEYIGKEIKGIKITEEGLLAASHLVGPYAVKDFVKTGGSMRTVWVKGKRIKKYDGNGTPLTLYLKEFENA